MKITWFGGMTLRVYIGGVILVTDPPAEAGEVVSGADRVFRLDDPAIPLVADWRPRAVRLVDEDNPPVLLHRMGESVLVDAVGEPPLVIGTLPAEAGRWAADSVVVLFAASEPPSVRVILLAMDDVEAAVAAMAQKLDGTGLVALERGMALEV